jgi:hypothetical protein
MIATEFFLIADRGALKVYLLSRNSTPTLRLAETVQIEETHKRFSDEYTDQAGSFPVSTGNGSHAHGVAERQSLRAEEETRGLRHIARKMTEVLRASQPRRWSFAAPSAINNAILDSLPADLRATLSRNLKKDLVKVAAADVLGHFEKLSPQTIPNR